MNPLPSNLVDYLHQMQVHIKIFGNDEPLEKILHQSYSGLIFSSGPGISEISGLLNTIIYHYQDLLPILGKCLGHQAIGSLFGTKLVKVFKPMCEKK